MGLDSFKLLDCQDVERDDFPVDRIASWVGILCHHHHVIDSRLYKSQHCQICQNLSTFVTFEPHVINIYYLKDRLKFKVSKLTTLLEHWSLSIMTTLSCYFCES